MLEVLRKGGFPGGVSAPVVRERAGRVRAVGGKFAGRRKVKPKVLAVVTEACTGCGGSPVCQPYCPVEDCMVLVSDPGAFPFQRIEIDPLKCVGCKKCVGRGPDRIFLDGCPWDAIRLVPMREWEALHGELPY